MAAAQTGTGKTAGFALPVLQLLATDGVEVESNRLRALVLVPTRELAEQVHASFRHYGGSLRLRDDCWTCIGATPCHSMACSYWYWTKRIECSIWVLSGS